MFLESVGRIDSGGQNVKLSTSCRCTTPKHVWPYRDVRVWILTKRCSNVLFLEGCQTFQSRRERRRSAAVFASVLSQTLSWVLSFLYRCGRELDWNWSTECVPRGSNSFCAVWWSYFISVFYNSVVEPFSPELLCRRTTLNGLAPRARICLRTKLFHVVFCRLLRNEAYILEKGAFLFFSLLKAAECDSSERTNYFWVSGDETVVILLLSVIKRCCFVVFSFIFAECFCSFSSHETFTLCLTGRGKLFNCCFSVLEHL